MLVDGINTLKRPFVDKVVSGLKSIPEVKGCILFGSSLTENCRDDSDVDLIIICDNTAYLSIGSKLFNVFCDAMNVMMTHFDVLQISSLDEFYTKDTILLYTLRSTKQFKVLFER